MCIYIVPGLFLCPFLWASSKNPVDAFVASIQISTCMLFSPLKTRQTYSVSIYQSKINMVYTGVVCVVSLDLYLTKLA